MISEKQKSNDKIAAWLVGLVAIVVLVLGVWLIYKNIVSPFRTEVNGNYVSTSDEEEKKLAALQTTDTDEDGLSDFDELYAYETSPYLKDSDSDSISDSEEIRNGTDPNCATGKTCGSTLTNGNTNAALTNTNLGAKNTNQTSLSGLSASQIREILKNAGAPVETINEMTDEEILEIYDETVAETGVSVTNVNAASTTNTTSTQQNSNSLYSDLVPTNQSITYQNLKNLSAAEIRQLIAATGMDTTTFDKIDDATLQAIFSQALAEEMGTSSTNQNTNK